MTASSPWPVTAAQLARAGQALATGFPGWQIEHNPAGQGLWSADWKSADGREHRHVAAQSTVDLVAALRQSAGIERAAT
jgi:hypothetical protein